MCGRGWEAVSPSGPVGVCAGRSSRGSPRGLVGRVFVGVCAADTVKRE